MTILHTASLGKRKIQGTVLTEYILLSHYPKAENH